MTTIKTIERVLPSMRAAEGDGMVIHRAFPGSSVSEIDPFLLLDEMGPLELHPGEGRGFPEHPHRGFETVTYLLEGQMEHRDSRGNHGVLRPGDVQWMTAGSGLVHSEMPGSDIVRDGGILHGFQLWVNLPRSRKMTAPHYQELTSSRIPVARNAAGNVEVKVISGEALGVRGPIENENPIVYLHFTVQPGGEHVQPIPAGFQAIVYLISGQGIFDAKTGPVKARKVLTFATGGDSVLVSNPAGSGEALDLLLLAGRPLEEPVARYGPFVMNTREELVQAFDDYKTGRMGVISRV
jgi:redox-sensitive bicupin YhaK (pirin superfamily)